MALPCTPPLDLVIIQNKETQFDAPLYSLIHSSAPFSLLVIYTAASGAHANEDAELGFSPAWDHLQAGAYPSWLLPSPALPALLRLAWQLKRLQPSLVVICGYYPRSQLLLALLLRALGLRIGLRSDNTLRHTQLSGLRGRVRRLVVGRIQRLFHTWHPVGEQAHAYLHSLSGTHRPSYRFAYAVDNDWLARESELSRHRRIGFLQSLGWPAEAFVVLGIMKWTEREDPLTLVEAFRLLAQREPLARLVLIGDGPLRERVMAACRPLAGSVHCPGFVAYSQLPLWYGRADVFVHPAPDEPWGCSVNEALACGLPVLAAEGVGAATEILASSACGSLFANQEPAQLADQLLQLAEQHDRSSLRMRAKQAANHWHYDLTISAFESSLKAKAVSFSNPSKL
jgi:glycosyltransferase involved in cell wall biosynthesis